MRHLVITMSCFVSQFVIYDSVHVLLRKTPCAHAVRVHEHGNFANIVPSAMRDRVRRVANVAKKIVCTYKMGSVGLIYQDGAALTASGLHANLMQSEHSEHNGQRRHDEVRTSWPQTH
jgi:hypothetical protein